MCESMLCVCVCARIQECVSACSGVCVYVMWMKLPMPAAAMQVE